MKEPSRYKNLTSFSVEDIVMQVVETVTPTITRYPADATWASVDEFKIEFDANKITVADFNISSSGREHTIINILHKPSGSITTSDVFVKNNVLSETDKQAMISEFRTEFGNDRFSQGHVKYLLEALNEVLGYDYTITRYCNMYKIPKEFVQTVLLREIWCYKPDDAVADALVMEYYHWKYHGGLEPVVKHTDSSTGIAQIFAATAIKALNNADLRGFIDLSEPYDVNNWEHMWAVWIRMHDDNTYCIRNCALVILDCQYELSNECPYSEFYNYSDIQVKRVISRYNGTGSEAEQYGEDCYGFFTVFKSYNG